MCRLPVFDVLLYSQVSNRSLLKVAILQAMLTRCRMRIISIY